MSLEMSSPMKITTVDIRGETEVHEGVDISLIDSKGILVISTPDHKMMRTYILNNLISYMTETEELPKPR